MSYEAEAIISHYKILKKLGQGGSPREIIEPTVGKRYLKNRLRNYLDQEK